MNPFKGIVVGIGDKMRADDALGPIVIDWITPLLPPLFTSQHCAGDLTALLEIFEHYDAVYLVDAIQGQTCEPGTLYRFTLETLNQVANQCRFSTHTFDLGQTIDMAQNLGQLPKQLVIYGIEAQNFELNGPLSPAVQNSLPKLKTQLIHELTQFNPENLNA